MDGGFDEAQDVAAVDVDGDGDLDILGAGYAGDVAWWQNTARDGSTWSKHLVAESFDGAVSVVAADVDGDGDPDILGAASVAGDLTWWKIRQALAAPGPNTPWIRTSPCRWVLQRPTWIATATSISQRLLRRRGDHLVGKRRRGRQRVEQAPCSQGFCRGIGCRRG